MVDFNPDKIYLYIPKNLSYEEKYNRYYSDNKFLQSLQLCDCKGDSRLFDKCVKTSFSQFLQRVGYKVSSRSDTDGAAASCCASFCSSSEVATCTTSGVDQLCGSEHTNAKSSSVRDAFAITSPTYVRTSPCHEISCNSLCALDLASSPSSLVNVKSSTPKPRQLFTKSNGGTTKMELGGPVSHLSEDIEKGVSLGCEDSGNFSNGNSADPSLTPLHCMDEKINRVELLLGARLDDHSDVTGTDFSEDYMRMTDVSDLDASTSIGSYSYDSESDFTQSFCERSDLSVFEDSLDLERVTINFDNMAVNENDINSIDCNGKEETTDLRSKSVDDSVVIKSSSPHGTGMVTKSRFLEKELPKIKIMLGQKTDVNNAIDNDTSDSPVFKPNSRSGTLFDTSQEFDFLQEKPVKRSTSLKTYKTPPGTPHRKKEVRFADALGLDLEDVRHVMNAEDPPKIPDSAMKDLQVGLTEAHKTEGTKYLSVCFSQPGASPVFVQRVMDAKVMLENCTVDGQEMTISGTVRVANIGYHKRVVVRFTVNNWKTFTDVFATYVQNSNDGVTDRFTFTIGVPNYFQTGDKAQFAVMYETKGQEFWDNNGGRNYIVECYATAVPVRESDNLWLHFL